MEWLSSIENFTKSDLGKTVLSQFAPKPPKATAVRAPAAAPVMAPMSSVPAASSSKWLIIGGAAIVGVLALILVLRK